MKTPGIKGSPFPIHLKGPSPIQSEDTSGFKLNVDVFRLSTFGKFSNS
jgi:hypothetical protein